jgi:hypothetical protein
MTEANTLSFHNINSLRQDIEKQIAYALIQKIYLINIKNTSMRFSEKTRLKHGSS